MPTGYLVTLGDNSLDPGDLIGGGAFTFTTDTNLGAGQWTWSGTTGGTTYTNELEPGVYYLATNGNVYFVPDLGLVDTISSASVTSAPSYTAPDGTVFGTAGADVIDGTYTDSDGDSVGAGDDIVFAGDGNDIVTTGGGADRVFGERGNDTVFAGSGTDTVYGGGGTDSIDAGLDADTVYGGSGNDSIFGNDGSDLIYGGSDSDTINGGNASDTVYGGAGNDVITDSGSATSADVIYGDSGNDSISAGAGNDIVTGGSGSDTIDGGAGVDSVEGGTGNDSILGGDGNDILIGDTDDVAVTGPESLNWTGFGVSGTDLQGAVTQNTGGMSVSVETTNDGNANNMSVSQASQYTEAGEPFAPNSSLQLGSGAGPTSTTVITFDPNLDTGLSDEVENVVFRINDIDQAGWQDVITINAYDADGNPVAVTITLAETGTATSDTVSGNTITAGNQSDTQLSSGGSALIEIAGPVHEIEIIYSNAGTVGQALWITDVHFDTAAIAETDEGNDTIDGGAGDDYIEGNGGNDSIVGGTGNDEIYAGAGDDTVGDWSTDDGNDSIYGGDGNDALNGGNGDDTIFGGAGADVITGASGNDTAYGGLDSDVFNVTDDHETVQIFGGEDGDGLDVDALGFYNFELTEGVTVTATGDEAGTFAYNAPSTSSGITSSGTYAEIEELNGTFYDDTFNMAADNSGVSIDANEGADIINTGSGNDVIEAGSGADTINAGAGNDTIGLAANSTPDGDADVIILQDGFGNDTVLAFDAPTPNGDGTFTGIDTLDVTGLTDAAGGTITTADVTVSDDGSGNALLTFPNGETLTLLGIDPVAAADPLYLNAIGIPSSDGTVEGTAGADTIGTGYAGDPDGDFVDNNDALLPGDTGDDDLIVGYGGNDAITAGAGDDEAYGGTGADSVYGGDGNDTLYGGDIGEVGDLIVNGSFEDLTGVTDTAFGGVGTGNITGWTDYNGGDLDLHDDGKGGTFATDGDYVLDMGGSPDNVHIYQDITGAVAGEVYNLTLDAGDVAGGGNSVEIYWGGELIATIDPVEGGMESYSFDLIGGAGDGANRLEFKEIGPIDNDGVQLDNVQLIGVDGTAATQDTSGDLLSGGVGADTLYGLEGNDTLNAGDDNDIAYGGAGNDTINAGSGDDTLYGGAGDDYLLATSGSDTVYGGDGNDEIAASIGSDEKYGGAGDDTITAGGFAGAGDTMDGGDGNDTLIGGLGDDTIFGGTGNDTISIYSGAGSDVISGGEDVGDGDVDTLDFTDNNGPEGVDVVMTGDESGTFTYPTDGGSGTFEEIEAIDLTDQDDSYDGTAATGGSTIDGGAGNDELSGSTGNDVFDGGTGDDTIFGGAGQDTLTGGDGIDTITGGADEDAIYGGPGDVIDGSETGVDNDTLFVEGAINIIYDSGNPENGIVQFASGPDLVFSNIENVVMLNDGTVSGTSGDDVIGAGYSDPSDSDTIDAGDAIIAGHGANDDLIEAGAGNDQIDASLGADTVYAGTGDDLIYAGADASADTVFGEAGSDTMFGFDGDDVLYGGADNDTVDGDGGNDSLYGGAGADELIGDAGTDTIYAGDGNDTIYAGADNDTIYGAEGDDLAYGAEGNDTFEMWVGNDTAYGGAGGDYIDGAQGNDELYGGIGNDTVLGGSDVGQDTLFGGDGDDTLSAGDGNDTLYGGTGADTQFGAGGDDVFSLEDNFGNDAISGGETSEIVGDILDASAVTSNLTLDLSTLQPFNPEMGTLTDGVSTATFEQIEYVLTGSGDDSIIGSSGDDRVATNTGADTIDLGAGNDELDLGDGAGGPDGEADVIILQDGSGNDTIYNFDAPTDNGDGTFTGIDTFDVTGLTDAEGNPVNVLDVTVTDTNGDGTGDAILTFPNGESITLVGVPSSQVDSAAELEAIGIPPVGPVDGTAGSDTMGVGFVDAQGDTIDGADGVDDTIYGYGGNDTIDGGAGDDTVYGGAGADRITDGIGNDTIFGGDGIDRATLTGGGGDDIVTDVERVYL